MLKNIKQKLKSLLKGKIVIIGVGNVLKGDDGVGSFLAQDLQQKMKIKVIDAGISLENYIGPIIKQNPDTVLLVDAVHFDADPGTVAIFRSNDFPVIHFSTHGMSPVFFTNMLHENKINNIIVIGIQPESITMGSALSSAVTHSLSQVKNMLLDIFK